MSFNLSARFRDYVTHLLELIHMDSKIFYGMPAYCNFCDKMGFRIVLLGRNFYLTEKFKKLGCVDPEMGP